MTTKELEEKLEQKMLLVEDLAAKIDTLIGHLDEGISSDDLESVKEEWEDWKSLYL